MDNVCYIQGELLGDISDYNKIYSIFERFGDAVICITKNDEIATANKIAALFAGKSADEMLGVPYQEFFSFFLPDSDQPLDVTQNISDVFEAKIVSEDGSETWFLCLCVDAPEYLKSTTEYILIFRDITAQKELNLRIRHSRRLDALGELTGGVAHDLNNILGGIMGCAELMALEDDFSQKSLKLIDSILNSANNAAVLNQKLLALSRKGNVKKDNFDIHFSIEDALEIIRRTVDRRIIVTVKLEASNRIISGDRAEIESALLNLAINARDAMPNGGELEISTRNIKIDSKYLSLHELEILPGEYLLINMRDTGAGIPKNILNKIFHPYFTTKGIGKGTGLGLSTVRDIIIEHEGAIEVESELGVGTSISLFLPYVHRGVEETELVSSIASSTGGVALLADDDEIMRLAVEGMLELFGYEVIIATNGEEAIKAYKENMSRIDIVLLDIVMPKMDGRDALRAIRSLDPEASVIVMSGYTRNRSIDEIMALGASAFLSKPFPATKLLEAINRTLQKAFVHKKEAQKIESTALPPVNENGLRTLLIEEDDTLQVIMSGILEDRGHNVTVARSIGKSRHLIHEGNFSLCIADLSASRNEGSAFIKDVKNNSGEQPIYCIATIEKGFDQDNRSILEQGVDDYIAKPFPLDLLAIRIAVAEKHIEAEQKRLVVEKALRENEARMALAINGASLGMWDWNFRTGEYFVSSMWNEVFGVTGQEIIDPLDYLHSVIHPDDLPEYESRVSSYVLDCVGNLEVEFRIMHPHKGYIWMMSICNAVEVSDDNKALRLSGFCMDITTRKEIGIALDRQRKQLEEMVMERTEELVMINEDLRKEMTARIEAEEENMLQQRKLMDADKLASLGTLVSGVGHEINNPTQFIMLNLPFLQGAWESAIPVLDQYALQHPDYCLRGIPYELARERVPVMAADIMEGAERIDRIVRELKDYARQGAGDTFIKSDLRKTVASSQTLLGHFIRKHTNNFNVVVPDEPLTVMVNPTRIEQVVINLVQNACLSLSDASKAITLEIKERDDKLGAEIIVTDEGCGIDNQHLRHLTEPFFTTRQSTGGTGLGLAICQRIIHNHGGELSFDSEVGKGTEVRVFLPYLKEKNLVK